MFDCLIMQQTFSLDLSKEHRRSSVSFCFHQVAFSLPHNLVAVFCVPSTMKPITLSDGQNKISEGTYTLIYRPLVSKNVHLAVP